MSGLKYQPLAWLHTTGAFQVGHKPIQFPSMVAPSSLSDENTVSESLYNEKTLLEAMEDAAKAERTRWAPVLAEVLAEAEGWLQDAQGCNPEDVIGYTGWADRARDLLRDHARGT